MFTPFAFVKQAASAAPVDPYPLTTAYLAATGITGSTNITALQDLEGDLDSYGLTSKVLALYPMIGGTIGTVKYNFMNPQDTDAAYRLVQSGSTPTITMNGVAGDGLDYPFPAVLINPSFNTNVPLSSIDPLSNHFITYNVTSPAANQVNFPAESGVQPVTIGSYYITMQLNSYFYGNNLTSHDNPSGTYVASFGANSTALGFYAGTRTSTTSNLMYRNKGGSKTTATNTSSVSGLSFTGGDTRYLTITTAGRAGSERRIAFYSYGTGLTESELDNYYTAVQAFQTTLGRQVT
jgi:hypothetical protein